MRYVIAILALAGAVVSGLALQVHYTVATTPCSINAKWDCGVVNHSSYSLLFGIPVALIGMAGYLGLAWLALARQRAVLTLAALAGLAFALYLAHVERDILGVWCLYCVISLGIAIALITFMGSIWLIVDASQRRWHLASRAGKLELAHAEGKVRALDVQLGDAADHAR